MSLGFICRAVHGPCCCAQNLFQAKRHTACASCTSTSLLLCAVHISGNRIVNISLGGDISYLGVKVLNFGDAVISPGVIDVHAHLNEPGREDWEGISTGTAAAAVGGITTLTDMPLNSFPATTNTQLLKKKQQLAEEKAHVGVSHWAGLIPGNAADHEELASLLAAGAMGFKSFMCPSGINDFPNVDAKAIAAALPFLKKAGVPFFVHAELVSDIPKPQGPPNEYPTFLASRPPLFEREAVRLLIELLDKDITPASPGFSVHIAHLSDAGCLPMIKEAKKRHPITVETCAHYLAFSEEEVPINGTLFKCMPPLRSRANQQELLNAVLDGTISLVSSDHSPAPPNMKQLDTGNFLAAWGGISGLQYLLPATWTPLQKAGADPVHLAHVLSEQPAKLLGMTKKGRISTGYEADLTVWVPEADADTSSGGNMHQHKASPYTGAQLKGKVIATIANGNLVSLYSALPQQPCGSAIKRSL
uniref:allantoinase n=1 Tax=Dunaliella tertiolecta TaxID=3047 RepID=A0A7S3QQ76_DUNTE